MDNGSWKWSDGLAVSAMRRSSRTVAKIKKKPKLHLFQSFALLFVCILVDVPELWPLLLQHPPVCRGRSGEYDLAGHAL